MVFSVPWIQGKRWQRTSWQSWRCRRPERQHTGQTDCRWSRPGPGLHVWHPRHWRHEVHRQLKTCSVGAKCDDVRRKWLISGGCLFTSVTQSAPELLALTMHTLNSPPGKKYWDTGRTNAEEPWRETEKKTERKQWEDSPKRWLCS